MNTFRRIVVAVKVVILDIRINTIRLRQYKLMDNYEWEYLQHKKLKLLISRSQLTHP